ncbi:MAG: hypothetical protein PHP74_04650, partial [Candidatus Gracilibacteria bacterium]|nr:hypothetical protein [Candidatus Gracilibacteria bacterium]
MTRARLSAVINKDKSLEDKASAELLNRPMGLDSLFADYISAFCDGDIDKLSVLEAKFKIEKLEEFIPAVKIVAPVARGIRKTMAFVGSNAKEIKDFCTDPDYWWKPRA